MSKPNYPTDFFEFTQRKNDHLDLAQQSQTAGHTVDKRFYYEPLFFQHPSESDLWPTSFLGFDLDFPIWISSMTGGVESSRTINENLARLCGEYKLGMGLGSCRSLLQSRDRFEDFNVRKWMGNQPLLANIGLTQLSELVQSQRLDGLEEMIKILQADGLIVHLNPLQEWFQPGGDRYRMSPLETLKRFLDQINYPVVVKEVGHGLGPKTLMCLMDLPLAAIEFGAYGGTNFSLLENQRANESADFKKPFIHVGHTAGEMVDFLNTLPKSKKEFIISGGIKTILDGYELKMKLQSPALIGMAMVFLSSARHSYEALQRQFIQMKEALLVAQRLLELKDHSCEQ